MSTGGVESRSGGERGIDLLLVEPLRNLSFWHIWALGVGAVIGDGIFLLLGQGIATAGPGAVPAYVVAGLIQLFIMVGLAELAVGMPSAGAMSVWVERFMGRWWGLLAGFAFALGWVIAGGSTGLAIGRFTCYFFPAIPPEIGTIVFAIIFVSIFCVLNMLGTLISARTQLYMVLGLVAIMVVFAIIGVFQINPDNLSPMLPYGWEGFMLAIPMGTYAYIGAVSLATAGSEAKRPADLPRALVWASITFLAVYTVDQLVVAGVVPWKEVTMDVSPFTLAGEKAFGPIGGVILNIAAWLAAATCILMGTVYSASRIFWSQAREGLLPEFFGYLHPKTRTPIWGIAVIWVASVVLILLGTIQEASALYVELSMQLVLAWLLSWSLALIAAILYRQRAAEEVAKLEWKQPLFPLLPILGLIGILLVTYWTFSGSPMSIVWAAVWIVALFLVYRFWAIPRLPAFRAKHGLAAEK